MTRRIFSTIAIFVIGLVPQIFAQPANAALTNLVTIVASGGASENSTWTYSNGEINTSANVSINASDVVAKVTLGNLVINADKVAINASVTHGTANDLTFRAAGNIIVGGGLTLQSQGGDIIFNSDADANNTGHIRFGFDANCAMGYITTNGGDIVAAGGANPRTGVAATQNNDAHATTCKAAQPIAGVAIYTQTFNAGGGDIIIRGGSPNLGNFSTRAINVNSAAGQTTSFQTTGNGGIYFYGDGSLISSNNAWGIACDAISISTDKGPINLEGQGNPNGPTNARGMSLGNTTTLTSNTGNITLLDRTNGTPLGYTGVNLSGGITASTQGNFTIQADEIGLSNNLTLTAATASMIPNAGPSFTATVNIAGTIAATNTQNFVIGSPGNTANITFSQAMTVGGPIAVYGSTIAVNAAITATNAPITFTASTSVTQGAVAITASSLNLRGSAVLNPAAFTVTGGSAQIAYIATFDALAGTGGGQTVFASGAAVGQPANPTREGYVFDGWFTAPSGGNRIAFPYTPSAADQTFYAGWISIPAKPPVSNWTTANVKFGEVVRITISGDDVSQIKTIESSSGKLTIASRSDSTLEIEITGAVAGIGWLKLSGTSYSATLDGIFSVANAQQQEIPQNSQLASKVGFSSSSTSLSAAAKTALLSKLKKISDPASFVITGSVAATKLTAAKKAIALARAKAVAKVVAQVFPGVKVKVTISAKTSIASANNNVAISFTPRAKN